MAANRVLSHDTLDTCKGADKAKSLKRLLTIVSQGVVYIVLFMGVFRDYMLKAITYNKVKRFAHRQVIG